MPSGCLKKDVCFKLFAPPKSSASQWMTSHSGVVKEGEKFICPIFLIFLCLQIMKLMLLKMACLQNTNMIFLFLAVLYILWAVCEKEDHKRLTTVFLLSKFMARSTIIPSVMHEAYCISRDFDSSGLLGASEKPVGLRKSPCWVCLDLCQQ